jgi:hypothetical protein
MIGAETLVPAASLLNYSNKLSHGTFGGPGFSVTTGLKGELIFTSR